MKKIFGRNHIRIFIIGIIIFSVIALIAAFFIIKDNFLHDPGETETQAESVESIVEKNPDSISIPGYEMLELKAGTREQSLCMPNPSQNCCYF